MTAKIPVRWQRLRCPQCGAKAPLLEIVFGMTAEPLDQNKYWGAGCVISFPIHEVHCPRCSWEGSKDAMRAYWATEVKP